LKNLAASFILRRDDNNVRDYLMIRPEEIRELLKRQPFHPFRMHMSSGLSYDVNGPEFALVTKGTIVVSKSIPGSAEPIGEGVRLVSVPHINNIEMLKIATTPNTGNGTV
jgi:hypothetical protein